MLAVMPAVIGVFAVAALAYWGQYARQAPEVVIIVAATAAFISLLLAWRNTRYVAQRVSQLAARARAEPGAVRGGTRDELDEIESTVHGLSDEVRAAEAERAAREAAADRRTEEMAALLNDLTARLADGMRDVQLPLHILLDSPFGELNENQEEMLQSARDAAEAAEVQLRQVRKFVELERGQVEMQVKPVGLAELLRPVLAIAEARAGKRNVALESSISPSAPRALVDPMHAQEAVTLALNDVVERVPDGGEVSVEAAESGPGAIAIRVTGIGADAPASLPMRLAERLIRAQGGSLRAASGELRIELRAEGLRATRASAFEAGPV
jgi:signal transduction histidine kinase